MKKVIAVLMGLMLSMSLFAKEIYVGTNAEFPPFEYLQDGKPTGFDMELIKDMGKVMGDKIKIVDMSFDGLLPALQMNKVDVVIAGMTATPERKKTVLFSNPYYTASQVIVVNQGQEGKYNSFDDLKGKKVGVMLGFTGDVVVSKIKGVEVKRYNASYAGIMALKAGKIDAVVLDSEPAKNFVAKNDGLAIAKAQGEQEEYAIAVRKNESALLEKMNKALQTLKENGTYDKLIQKYFK